MTATNHALTGAAIGLIVGIPWIALPAALASHFICDALPHFDRPEKISSKAWMKSKTFHRILMAEFILCVSLVIVLGITRPVHWVLAAFCAFLATSPDLLWLNRFLKNQRNKKWQSSRFAKFAGNIQWFAKPIGSVVEVAWFIGGVTIIYQFIR